MLKVGMKRNRKKKKEREKAHTQPRKQNTRYVRSLNVRINQATHRTNANKCKYLLQKKIKAEGSVTLQNIFSLFSDFRAVV